MYLQLQNASPKKVFIKCVCFEQKFDNYNDDHMSLRIDNYFKIKNGSRYLVGASIQRPDLKEGDELIEDIEKLSDENKKYLEILV